MQNQQETTLIAAFKQMTEKERLWLLALTANCLNQKKKAPDEAMIFMRTSKPGE